MGRIVLVLGGARSGKSTAAEKLVDQYERVAYIATAQALDEEMRERIRRHQKRRPKHWRTFEQPFFVHDLVARIGGGFDALLIDCATLYISNMLLTEEQDANKPGYILREIGALCDACRAARADVVIVSNEVGGGIVPDNEAARAFRDIAGLANQRLAACAEDVYYMIAGIGVRIKGGSRSSGRAPSG